MRDSGTLIAVVGFFIGAVGIFVYTLIRAVKINQKRSVKKEERRQLLYIVWKDFASLSVIRL